MAEVKSTTGSNNGTAIQHMAKCNSETITTMDSFSQMTFIDQIFPK